MSKKQAQEELDEAWTEYVKQETSFAINGLLRIAALIVILIAAMILGTP